MAAAWAESDRRAAPGEPGKKYELEMEVLSFSVEEDWVTGVSRVPVTYSAPYAARVPYFPADVTTKYVASTHTKDSTQPYIAVPWVAQFAGCCRQYAASDGSWSFNLTAYVDLTNSKGSTRIVSLPEIWVPPAPNTPTTPVYVCAIPVAGMDSLVLMSGGTLNYPKDDMQPAGIKWEVAGFSASPGAYAYFNPPPLDAVDCKRDPINCKFQLCQQLVVAGVTAPTGKPSGYVGYVTIAVSIGTGCHYGGCTRVLADIAINSYDIGQAAVPTNLGLSSPFRCNNLGDVYHCRALVSSGLSLLQALDDKQRLAVEGDILGVQYVSTVKPLELRYVVATKGGQSGLLASSQGRVYYSNTEKGQDHSALPNGMRFTAPSGIHDIQVLLALSPPGSLPTPCPLCFLSLCYMFTRTRLSLCPLRSLSTRLSVH